jgi:NADPH:quinone reductase-like Zn-dependent oxidoreductase
MKANYINNYGGPEELVYGDLQDPVPSKGEVLIQIKASSINPLDFKIRSGFLKIMSGSSRNKVLGTDFSGIVIKLGEGVTSFKEGDSVYGSVLTILGKQGSFAEFVVANIKKLRSIPSCLNFDSAASIPVGALTALNGFRQCGDLNSKKVLINGATGGVGHFAIQIARAKGAHVTAVCSSKNFDFAKEMGANECIDYSKTNILTNGLKYDIFFDAFGKLNLKTVSPILTHKGFYISTLMNPLLFLKIPFLKLLGGKQIVPGNMRDNQEDYQEIEELVASGKVKPFIGQTFKLSQTKDAIEVVESGKAKGKIIVVN